MSSASSVLATRCLIKPNSFLLICLMVWVIFLLRSAAIGIAMVIASSMYMYGDGSP